MWGSKANTHGTKSRVATVATRSPPITARPNGAFWVLDIDIGSMPMIIAMAVINTGRMRVYPAAMAARDRIAVRGQLIAGERHHQNRVGGCRTHTHDRTGQCRHRQSSVGQEERPNDARKCPWQCGDDDERIEPGTES